jgi:hypothetical protein
MESALSSNVELLIILYAYIGAWRCIVSSTTLVHVVSTLLPLLATVHCRLFIESIVPWPSIILLSYVADSIFLLLRLTLRYSVRGIWLSGRVKTGVLWRVLLLFAMTACGTQLVYAIIALAGKRHFELLNGRSLLALASFVFSPVLALALTAGLSRQSVGGPRIDRYVDSVTWTLPLVLLILAGEVYYIFVRGKASSTSGAALIWKVAPVAFRLIIGYLDVNVTNPVRGETVGRATFTLLQAVRVFLVLVASPLIFKSGGSFYIGHVLVAVSGVEIVETMACLLARTNVVEKEE